MVNLYNNLAEFWALYFGAAILQNTIFLGLIFLALTLLRHADARIKHNIALLGIIKLLIPPFIPGPFNRFFTSNPVTNGQAEIGALIPVTSSQSPELQLSMYAWIMLVWLLVFAGYLLLILISTLRLKANLSDAKHITTYGRVSLYASKHVSSPLSIGLLPRRIYLPDWWHELNASSQKTLLNHEMAHLLRKDGLVHFFQTLAQALYFFHPLVWLLNERIYEYREMACDDMAVSLSSVSANAYTHDLLHFADNMNNPQWSFISASALIKRKHKILNRIHYQLQEETMQNNNSTLTRVVLVVLALLIIPLSWYCSKDSTSSVNETTAQESTMNAQNYGSISGHVTDAQSGKTLSGVDVMLQNTRYTTKTDKKGMFSLNSIPAGSYTLIFQVDGFGSVIFESVNIQAKQSTQLDCKMTPMITNEKAQAPPPPIDESEFVEYDSPPAPMGGFSAIQKKLVYPELARKAGIEGRVIVRSYVDKNGDVVECKIMQSLGNNGCDESAMAAIKETKWIPAKNNGEPVGTWIAIPVMFSLK